MIAPRLLDELRELSREDKLEVIRFLQAEIADEECSEWDTFLKTGGVARIPSVRVDFGKRFFKMPTLYRLSAEAASELEQLERESQSTPSK